MFQHSAQVIFSPAALFGLCLNNLWLTWPRHNSHVCNSSTANSTILVTMIYSLPATPTNNLKVASPVKWDQDRLTSSNHRRTSTIFQVATRKGGGIASGQNGLTRVVILKIAITTLIRPVTKLACDILPMTQPGWLICTHLYSSAASPMASEMFQKYLCG